MSEILRCEQLAIGYEGKVLIENLSFTVEKGDYFCIVGENGAGKSTLMKTLLGLQKPLAGKILWQTRHKHIGYLPQDKNIQADFPAIVEEVVLSGAQNRKDTFPFYRKQHRLEAHKKLERLGILPLAKNSFQALSGGQRQRVLLARALMATEQILLLDEPVTGLDPSASQGMYDLIADLNKKDGVTIVMISHDLRSTYQYANHILRLGESVFKDVPKAEIWNEERHL